VSFSFLLSIFPNNYQLSFQMLLFVNVEFESLGKLKNKSNLLHEAYSFLRNSSLLRDQRI
jgi:hypothetical protein